MAEADRERGEKDRLALLLVLVAEEMLFGKNAKPAPSSSRIKISVNSALNTLNELNQQQKQLLVDALRVKLAGSTVFHEVLPKELAEHYKDIITKKLGEEIQMNARYRGGLEPVVAMDMKYGNNTSGMDEEGLRRIMENLDNQVGSLIQELHLYKLKLKENRSDPGPEESQDQDNRPKL
jgi:hypothetical protein